MQCPSCKSEDAYAPFYGPIECVNPSCSLYNERHRAIVEKDKATKQDKRIAFYPVDFKVVNYEFTPLGIYAPYIPIQVTDIYKKIKDHR
jgi:hypothetical protein